MNVYAISVVARYIILYITTYIIYFIPTYQTGNEQPVTGKKKRARVRKHYVFYIYYLYLFISDTRNIPI